ncbi:endo-1,4-beta-xylanase [Niabella terrae]
MMYGFNSKIRLLMAGSLLALAACGGSQQIATTNSKGLKDQFRNAFLIGTALDSLQVAAPEKGTESLIGQQFNAITAENGMKAEHIHPQWGRFDFNWADRFINYGQTRDMYIVGHTLIWHSQLPDFVRSIQSADSLQTFLQLHINTIVSRYAGKVDSWDVVNEALNEDGSYRKSIFFEKLGAAYIADAFKLAATAAPDAALYYNDYNIEQPRKRAGALRLIEEARKEGARIDGVGIQGHWHSGTVPFEAIEQSIREFAAAGLKVAITELDLNVLPAPPKLSGAEISQRFAADPALNPYPTGLPQAQQQQLAADYERLFRLFVKYRQQITRISFWGVNDRQSWLNNWPVPGRTNYPLLFDRDSQPKPAYFKVRAIEVN